MAYSPSSFTSRTSSLASVDAPTHDEINLVRLLRRLEKTAIGLGAKEAFSLVSEEGEERTKLSPAEVWFEARKGIQTLRFARTMVKIIELEAEDTPTRAKRLTDAKAQMDRLEKILVDIDTSAKRAEKEKKPNRTSLLASLPLPKPPTAAHVPDVTDINLSAPIPDNLDAEQEKQGEGLQLAMGKKPTSAGLTIDPPPPDSVSPSLIDSALPSLLPLNPSEQKMSTSIGATGLGAPPFGGTVSRRTGAGVSTSSASANGTTNGNGTAIGSTALHEELSTQLEMMAQQLKRNAIHFSTSLGADKAVVEEMKEKLESNYSTLESSRKKLRDRGGEARSLTWLTLAVVLAVILLFVIMVGLIRFSRR